MSVCVLVPGDGSPARRVVWEQSHVSEKLGGCVTFIGMKDDLIAVALVNPENNAPPCRLPSDLIFKKMKPRGDAVIIAVDDAGAPIDVDVNKLDFPVSS